MIQLCPYPMAVAVHRCPSYLAAVAAVLLAVLSDRQKAAVAVAVAVAVHRCPSYLAAVAAAVHHCPCPCLAAMLFFCFCLLVVRSRSDYHLVADRFVSIPKTVELVLMRPEYLPLSATLNWNRVPFRAFVKLFHIAVRLELLENPVLLLRLV